MTTLAVNLLDQLLGLDKVSFSDARTVLSWEHPVPAWGWALIVIGAAALSFWSYYKLMGKRPARLALSAIRGILVIIIAILLAGPIAVLKDEIIEPDCVVVLVDRSASMTIRDMTASEGANKTYITRDQALRNALADHPDLFGPEGLGIENRRIVWLGFDGESYDLSGVETLNDDAPSTSDDENKSDAPRAVRIDATQWPQPQGTTTALRTAIDQAVQKVAGSPIAGIILITDGRSPQATGSDVVRKLNQLGAQVFSVPLGALDQPLDLTLARVDYPERAFSKDVVPISIEVANNGGEETRVDPSRITVRLIDEQTGQTLDEQTGVPLEKPVKLSTRSATVGEVKWKVQVVYDGAGQEEEIILDNNVESFAVELVDRPIRVLLVEGYPRWEYRYLKNLLIREESISSSILLLSADRNFSQEGDEPISRMPRDADEIEPYDLVIIGDVPSRYFGAQIMNLMRDHVAVRGAGLIWIGGPGNTPVTYETTPLADLLPMRRPVNVDRADVAFRSFAMVRTTAADALNVLQIRPLDADPEDEVPDALPDEIPPFQWAQQLGPLKPTAVVLAESQPLNEATGAVPLVVNMNYGAGQSLYIATDELWRWRYGRGEFYYEQFWVQIVRMMGQHRLMQDRGAVRLDASARQSRRGDAIVVELLVNDELLLQRNLPSVAVNVTDDKGTVVDKLELRATEADDGDFAPDDQAVTLGKRYRAMWEPQQTGRLTLKLAEAGFNALDVFDTVEVYHPDDERRQSLPDHDRLETLASETKGKVVTLDKLDTLAVDVPKRPIRKPNDLPEPIWDSYLALLVVLSLLTIEWVGRKMLRLV